MTPPLTASGTGKDAQAIITRGVRVRKAGVHAYRIENADSWWSDCEGTTTGSTGAGFHITGSNLNFEHCKAWYCRGYGWRVRGVRNTFTGCASQDTRYHGWRIDYQQNTLTACTADTAAAAAVGGTPNSADGFHVYPDTRVVLTGCLAYDRRPGNPPGPQPATLRLQPPQGPRRRRSPRRLHRLGQHQRPHPQALRGSGPKGLPPYRSRGGQHQLVTPRGRSNTPWLKATGGAR